MAAIAAAVSPNAPLPPRLINFFAKYPPRLYGVHFTKQLLPTTKQKIAKDGDKRTKTGPQPNVFEQIQAKAEAASQSESKPESKPQAQPEPEAEAHRVRPTIIFSEPAPTPEATIPTISEQPQAQPEAAQSLLDPETQSPIFHPSDIPPNPFLPYKNPATGRWRGATISLRTQADLFKLARVYGVEPLLPASRKSTAFKEARALERGLAVQGTGEGQKVKGHKWERGMGGLLQKRITAMERMPELIREWRMRGNGRGWKKYPK